MRLPGLKGVPGFHSQFIGIAGVVEFTSEDPSKLPLNTTKRGIESSSELYLHVLDFIQQGIKVFTTFTYKMKRADRELVDWKESHRVPVAQLLEEKPSALWKKLSSRKYDATSVEKVYVPTLPDDDAEKDRRTISFVRASDDIKLLGQFFFGDEDASPSNVGSACFDAQLRKARK